jgi:histidyl-tRNA synthetase
MGDMVITDLIRETPGPAAKLESAIAGMQALDIFVVIAEEERRGSALEIVQRLRKTGYRVGYPLSPTKIGKQFQSAEQQKSLIAVVIGAEFPVVTIKNLDLRLETTCGIEDFDVELTKLLLPG